MSRVSIGLFCCPLEDAGWPASVNGEMREDLDLLDKAMLTDLADRLAGTGWFSVIVYETNECNLERIDVSGYQFVRKSLRSAPLSGMLGEASSAFFRENEGSCLVVVYGRNPLVAPEVFRAMEALTHEEEEVIAIVERRSPGGQPDVVAAAMRSSHPPLHDSGERGRPNRIELFLESEAMLVPLQPIHDFANPDGLPLLLHEVERRMLLGQWYPLRTLAALHMMYRKGVFEKL